MSFGEDGNDSEYKVEEPVRELRETVDQGRK